MIPKIIHQTWKNKDIKPEWKKLQQSWKAHHPDWEYRFWTDEDNRNFISQYYSWFLPIYDAYDRNIKKANAVRHFIMYHYGGIYADLDLECLRPFDELLEGQELVFGLEPPNHLTTPNSRNLDKIVCDAFIASRPGHSFWAHLFNYLVDCQNASDVLDAVSVYLVTRAYNTYSEKQKITIFPSEILYPISIKETWENNFKDEAKRKQLTEKAFAIHYWHGSWWREIALERVHESLKRKKAT